MRFIFLLSLASAAVVSQIGDGQIQATTATEATVQAISQIGDGQIQATTATPATVQAVSQIGDGQIQATTKTPTTLQAVSQIGDGQIQATTVTLAPITGTLPILTVVPVSQITDGQVQATTGGLRTLSTLFGSDYSALSLSKAVSGGLSGSLVTFTTRNANGVEVTIVASAAVTGASGQVSIGTQRPTGASTVYTTSNGMVITEIVNGGQRAVAFLGAALGAFVANVLLV